MKNAGEPQPATAQRAGIVHGRHEGGMNGLQASHPKAYGEPITARRGYRGAALVCYAQRGVACKLQLDNHVFACRRR